MTLKHATGRMIKLLGGMEDRLHWMTLVLRMIIGIPIAAFGYGLILGNKDILGLIAFLAGLVIAIPNSVGWVLSILYFAVAIPTMIWLFWKVNQFMHPGEFEFFDWVKSEIRMLPFYAVVGLIYWWWQSGDPFKDREL
jgi:hypothetical protein